MNAAIHFVFAFAVSRLKAYPAGFDLSAFRADSDLCDDCRSRSARRKFRHADLDGRSRDFILDRARKTNSALRILLFSADVSVDCQPFSRLDVSQRFRVRRAELTQINYTLFNGTFITSIVFVIAFAFIIFLNKDEKYEPALKPEIHKPLSYLIPTIALCVLYNTFRMEIGNYFHFQRDKTSYSGRGRSWISTLDNDNDHEFFNIIWQINYTMSFLSVLSFINSNDGRTPLLAFATIFLNVFTLFIFLTVGLYFLGELRESYLSAKECRVLQSRLNAHSSSGIFPTLSVAGLIFSLFNMSNRNFCANMCPGNLWN